MRLTQEKAAKNKAHVIATAEKLFRERGFEGVAVADLMHEAGFTHGGFYNHFESKEDLAAAALKLAFEQAIGRLEQRAATGKDTKPAAALKGYIESYLSNSTRDAKAVRCPMAAFGTSTLRQGPSVQKVFAAGVKDYLDSFAKLIPEGNQPERLQESIRVYSALVGALMLSRSLAQEDEALANKILETVRSGLLADL
jgi:TetR/AcrR family transcriptional repressor of nem operon